MSVSPHAGEVVAPHPERNGTARHERNAEGTKRRLLLAAEIEFAAKGFDGARLGNIAPAAGVQQALIHHYFDDKEGLYREVLSRGLAAVTEESWDILAREGAGTMEALCRAFVESLVRFYSTHRSLLAILRHEANSDEESAGGHTVHEMVVSTVRPVFEAAAARIEELKGRGEVAPGVDARRLCLSVVAMAIFPFQEEKFLAALWPIDFSDPAVLEAHKREIVETVLARAKR